MTTAKLTGSIALIWVLFVSGAGFAQLQDLLLLDKSLDAYNLSWSPDSVNLVLLRGNRSGVEAKDGEWVNYNTVTEQITTSTIWPLLPSLDTTEKEIFSPAYNGLAFMFESPNKRYVVYSHEIGQYLTIGDRTTLTKFISEGNTLYGPAVSADSFNVKWSEDNTAFVAAQPAPFDEGYIHYFVNGFSTNILNTKRTIISELIGNRLFDYRTFQVFDISEAGDTLLIFGHERKLNNMPEYGEPKLILWNAADPDQSQILDNFDAANLAGASFAPGSSTQLLVINAQGLIVYDSVLNIVAVLNSKISSPWVESALFSPDSSHVVLIHKDDHIFYTYLADLRGDLPAPLLTATSTPGSAP